jgi:predicted unusual protein kinase regulating ubiquinone biosynthesis (AarF/ABC1/UbiB family)
MKPLFFNQYIFFLILLYIYIFQLALLDIFQGFALLYVLQIVYVYLIPNVVKQNMQKNERICLRYSRKLKFWAQYCYACMYAIIAIVCATLSVWFSKWSVSECETIIKSQIKSKQQKKDNKGHDQKKSIDDHQNENVHTFKPTLKDLLFHPRFNEKLGYIFKHFCLMGGVAFVKMAQIIACKDKDFDSHFLKPLKELLENCPCDFDQSEIEQVFGSDYLRTTFLAFDPNPIAAGSCAHVHIGVVKQKQQQQQNSQKEEYLNKRTPPQNVGHGSLETVIVKINSSLLDDIIDDSFVALKPLLLFLVYIKILLCRPEKIKHLMSDMNLNMKTQLDMIRERRNQNFINICLENNSIASESVYPVIAPKTLLQYSGPNHLTMEYINEPSLLEAIPYLNDYERKKLINTIMVFFQNSVFNWQILNADMHAGNFKVRIRKRKETTTTSAAAASKGKENNNVSSMKAMKDKMHERSRKIHKDDNNIFDDDDYDDQKGNMMMKGGDDNKKKKSDLDIKLITLDQGFCYRLTNAEVKSFAQFASPFIRKDRAGSAKWIFGMFDFNDQKHFNTEKMNSLQKEINEILTQTVFTNDPSWMKCIEQITDFMKINNCTLNNSADKLFLALGHLETTCYAISQKENSMKWLFDETTRDILETIDDLAKSPLIPCDEEQEERMKYRDSYDD